MGADKTERVAYVPSSTVTVLYEDGPHAGLRVECSSDVSMGIVMAYRRPVPRDAEDRDERNEAQLRQFGEEILLEWNLSTPKGQDIPADGDGMLAIPGSLAFDIMGRWLDAMVAVPAPLDGASNNGDTSPVASTRTAASSASRPRSRKRSSS